MIKIAVSGQARTGKNTLAEMLISHILPNDKFMKIDSKYKIVAVADPIKNMVMQMIPGADPECLWGRSELRSMPVPGNFKDIDGSSLTYRRVLMDIGSLGRRYNDDVWLDALVQDANKNNSLVAYIVSDVRFINEINYLKHNGFAMIRIKRNDVPKIDDVSETAQLQIPDDFFDHIIENNGSLSDLNDQARIIVHKLV